MRGKGFLLFGNLRDTEKVENISLENFRGKSFWQVVRSYMANSVLEFVFL